MSRVVFSTGLFSTWGSDLVSTLVDEGDQNIFLDLYAAMAGSCPATPASDGDVLRYAGQDFMILALIEKELNRLAMARLHMVGSLGENLMICERFSCLIDRQILSPEEIRSRSTVIREI